MIIINKQSEIEKYYNKSTNAYEFVRDGKLLDIQLNFHLDIGRRNIEAGDIDACDIKAGDIKSGDIKAWNIRVCDIKAGNIKAGNIDAYNIKANDISYYAFCISYNDIVCKSIKGRRVNSFHKCIDGDLKYVKEVENE